MSDRRFVCPAQSVRVTESQVAVVGAAPTDVADDVAPARESASPQDEGE